MQNFQGQVPQDCVCNAVVAVPRAAHTDAERTVKHIVPFNSHSCLTDASDYHKPTRNPPTIRPQMFTFRKPWIGVFHYVAVQQLPLAVNPHQTEFPSSLAAAAQLSITCSTAWCLLGTQMATEFSEACMYKTQSA